MFEIKTLLGAIVTKIIAGGGNGSIILLEFKNADNDFVLYIYCTWRYSYLREVIVTSNDQIDGNIISKIEKINETSIVNLITDDFNDLIISFSNGYQLDVFCDNTNNHEENSLDNWVLCNKKENLCYVFDSNFTYQIESYR